MADSIDITGLNKAELLAALYNNSKPQGLGFLSFDAKPMTVTEAVELLTQQTYFDYLNGRVMKIDLRGNQLNTWAYDRDLGQGAAARVVEAVRTGQGIGDKPRDMAKDLAALDDFLDAAPPTTVTEVGGMTSVELGLDEGLKNALQQKRERLR
jgi:hypothetical protein